MDSAAALPTVTAIIIGYGDEPWLEQSVKSALASTGVVADVVVVDNGCTDGGVELVRPLDGVAVAEPGRNTGFAGGCNFGVSRATGDYVALVNADAIVEPDALDALVRVAGRSGVGIATASIRLADRPDIINSAGNDIHCTGVSWSGGFGEKAVDHDEEREAFAASGAGMAMRRSTWNELGGFDEVFFAYYEDADLSMRAWQRGLHVVYVPDAVVLHRYEFGRRPEKFFLLERNRLLMVLGCYEQRTLWYLAPLLASMEIGFLVLAVREGWWRQKLGGWGWLLRHRREVRARRSRLQAARVVADADLVYLFSDDLLPGNYEAPSWWPKFNRIVRAYWRRRTEGDHMMRFRWRLVAMLVATIAGLVVTATASAPAAGAATLPPGLTESVIGGLNVPTAMAFAPDGRLFITEQTGALRVVQNGVLLPAPFATLPVDSSGERGLLGVAFPPDFASSHRVYVYFTQPTPSPHNVVAWFGGANGNTASTGPNIVVTLPNLSGATNHNGGGIHFSPSDGQLYIAVGENANGANSQNLTTPLGKILRVTGDGAPSPGNPTFGGTAHDGRVWAWGLRNPFTFAFDTSGALFINDVGSGGTGACGSGTWEEINLGAPAANYGWPIVEGPPITPQCTNAFLTPPIYSYPHTDPSNPCAIAGGTFYRPANPLLGQGFVGDYFFADLCGGWIRYRRPDGSVAQLASNISAPVDVHTGPDGALWYLSHSGSVGRIAPPTAPWQVFLRNSPIGGGANVAMQYGIRGDDVLFCDWDGNGTDTIGVHRGNTWFLNNANDSSPPEAVFTFGDVGDVPVCGDWNGNGTDTVGVRRGNTFFLRNSNSTGVADVPPVVFGNPGDIPVVGHWTGGSEGVGVRRGNMFFLRNSLTSGVADTAAVYGNPFDQPIVGDWDGNGTDTVGVRRGFTFFLRNSDTSGFSDISSAFGNIGDLAVAGNFDGVGGDGIGVLR